MAQASHDQNRVPSLLGTSNADGTTPVAIYADPITHRLLVDLPGGSGTVTQINTTAPISGGPITTTGTITTSMATNKLIGRGSASTGVMEEITLGTNLSLSGTTLNAAGISTLTIGTTTITSGTNTRILYDNSGVIGEYTITGTGTVVAMQANPTLSGVTMTDATDIALGSTTGTKIGTATTQKLAFYNSTPIVKPSGDVVTALSNLGLVATPTVAATSIVVGTTTVTSGTNTRILYDNSGTLGEYTISGSGTIVAMATSPTFTTGATTPQLLATANDSGALGASGTAFADLFLASGGVINWAANNANITHSSGILTVAAGELRITSANVGSNADSVPTLSSTSTLTSKTLTSPTIQTSPVFAAATQLKLTVPTGAGTATGPITNEFNSAYSSTAIGDVVYFTSSGTWQKADNSTSATTYSGFLGVALSVAASGAAVTVALPGSFIFASAWNLATVGAPVYLGTAAGITLTAPTTTDTATRIVGYVVASGNTTTKIWFNPSSDWITHA